MEVDESESVFADVPELVHSSMEPHYRNTAHSTTSNRVPMSRQQSLYVRPPQSRYMSHEYAHIPGRMAINLLKLVRRRTEDLYNRNGNEIFGCESFISCEFHIPLHKITDFFICLPYS
jgi:hypothetical protein